MMIHKLPIEDLPVAMQLVWQVFLEFEAPVYTEQGVQSFYEYIQLPFLQPKIENSELKIWGAYTPQLAGVVALRNDTHISLLFVAKAHHRKGIATALVQTVADACLAEGATRITVNSSPYALPFYRATGFVETDEAQVIDGIRFTPMQKTL